MSLAHHRRKDPEFVRSRLLDAAAQLAVADGLASLTLDSVAKLAEVSKGGLLHHFPDKRSLVDGLFAAMIEGFDHALDDAMRADPVSRGRFSRSYLKVVATIMERPVEQARWATLTMMLLADPPLRERWVQWVRERAEDHIGTDSGIDHLIIRLAADGLWLADTLGVTIDLAERRRLLARLMSLSVTPD